MPAEWTRYRLERSVSTGLGDQHRSPSVPCVRRQATKAGPEAKRPARGPSASPFRGDGSPRGRLRADDRGVPSQRHVIDGHRPPALRGSGRVRAALLDVAIAAVALGRHAGAAHPRRRHPSRARIRRQLDLIGVVLAGVLDGAAHRLAALPARRVRGDRGGERAAGRPRLSARPDARPHRRPVPARRQPRPAEAVDGAHHRHRGRAARGLPGRGRRRARHLSGDRAAPHRSGLGRGLVRRRAHPPAARADRRTRARARCAPSATPSASGCSPSPRSAPGSPAICTTRPATPSA